MFSTEQEFTEGVKSQKRVKKRVGNPCKHAKSKNEKGITTNIGFVEHAGTPMQVLPMTGLIQLDDQDDYHIAAIRRDAETGNLQLISFLKNLYIRLDDYVSEYDQPGYKYDANQEQIKQTQNFILQDQGLNKYLKK